MHKENIEQLEKEIKRRERKKDVYFLQTFTWSDIQNKEIVLLGLYKTALDTINELKKFFDHDKRGDFELLRIHLNDCFLDYAFAVKTKRLELEKSKTLAYNHLRKKHKHIKDVDREIGFKYHGESELVGRAEATVDKYSKKIL